MSGILRRSLPRVKHVAAPDVLRTPGALISRVPASPVRSIPCYLRALRMSARALIALGTSRPVPTRYRNHNGYLLRWDEHGLLFDPGEGTQRQMIFAEVTVTQVTKILITHFHGDHCLGLAGISQRISLDRVPHEIEVYFPRSGRKYFDRLRKASVYHDVSSVRACPIDGNGVVHKNDKFEISVARLDHAVEAFGYRLEEHDGRTMLPEKLAEAGVKGPAVKQLINQGS